MRCYVLLHEHVYSASPLILLAFPLPGSGREAESSLVESYERTLSPTMIGMHNELGACHISFRAWRATLLKLGGVDGKLCT